MQSPSEIDDDKFQVAKASKLDRPALLTLQQGVLADRHELETWQRNGGSPQQRAHWEEDYRRKGKQIQWIAKQLGKIRDSIRAQNRKANDKDKRQRRGFFFEAFFQVCQRELEPKDFKELAEIAKQRSGEWCINTDMNITPEVIEMFDGACRARDAALRTAFLDRIQKWHQESHPDENQESARDWARKAVAYWAGYFSHEVRLRVEKLYEAVHPCFGPATKGPVDPTQAFLLGMSMDRPTFSWPMRPPPYPDEP